MENKYSLLSYKLSQEDDFIEQNIFIFYLAYQINSTMMKLWSYNSLLKK